MNLQLKLFNWHKDTRTLTADASTLNLVGELPRHIVIENPDTKQSRVFRFLNEAKDREGDVQAWHYENISHGLKLTIWND